MIYQCPPLDDSDRAVLSMIDRQKERLKLFTSNAPRRWFGSLRRSTMARAIQGSNSIEGYHATLDDAMAAVEDELMSDERTETARAIRGYRDALTYIFQTTGDPHHEMSAQLLKSLHFMMLGYDLAKYPGQWRPGSVFVVDAKSGATVYTAPGAEEVNGLVEELVTFLKESSEPLIIKAAMAHLNLTMIHPFKDGNGRMARALQTLVLARGGTLHPVFSSIEEWLGENTQDYYAVLAQTGRGEWSPRRSALPWIRFCLKAHYQQAATLIRRNEEYEQLYDKITVIADRHKLPERTHVTLFDAALGFRVTNVRHRAEASVGELVASRDLRKMCETGLLAPFGEKRGRFYRAGDELLRVRAATRAPTPLIDPYAMERRRVEPLSSLARR
jgi:Fic family protein